MSLYAYLVFLLAISDGGVWARSEDPGCEVRARTSAGWVCGTRRWAAQGRVYASFRGVPYAKQPVGELRFKELEPPEPWSNMYDARQEGHVCPQVDVLYGPLMKPNGMSEKCIFANIHVPIEVLPAQNQGRLARDLKSPAAEAREDAPEEVNRENLNVTSGAPILVFIHGGGFAFGSGDSDLHGPEHLVSNGVIVITFNYRLNVFGFLSLNTTQVPGNNGLRDMVTLLRWVRENAKNFGGDPDQVTLAGQSAGAAAAHLLTLSPEAQGLFKKAILMSGTAIPTFYTTSPVYARYMAQAFVASLGINSTSPSDVHQQLVDMPLEKLMTAHKMLLDQNGLAVFTPVIETPIPEIKAILPEDTETLLAKGYGRDVPLMIGYTNDECETFRKRFEELDIVARFKKNPLFLVSPNVVFSFSMEQILEKVKKTQDQYFNDWTTTDDFRKMDQFVRLCTDMYMEYPALKVAQYRTKADGAPTYVYQFSYDGHYSPIKEALDLRFLGAGHIEDMTYVFQVHSVSPTRESLNKDSDADMTKLMASYFTNFMKYDRPTLKDEDHYTWRAVGRDGIRYQVLHSPTIYHPSKPTDDQYNMLSFFNTIRGTSAR